MKILLISDVYFPRINGVSTSILLLRRELAQFGHETALVVPNYAPIPGVIEEEDTIFRVPAYRFIFEPEDRQMQFRALRKILSQLHDFDLVHIHTPFIAHYAGLSWARRRNLPCVASYHTFFEEYLYHYLPLAPPKIMRYLARRFSRSQAHQLDALVVPSQAIASILRSYKIHTPIKIIPTGIDPHDLSGGNKNAFRTRYGISPDRLILIYVGRVAFEKNIEFLIEVVEKTRHFFPQLLFLIVGDGPARNYLERRVAQMQIVENVRFLGYLDRHGELRDAYQAADVFIFASATETQGLVLLEAMAMGIPIVSTAQLGTVDILQAGQGAIIAQPNIEDFTAQLRRVLQEPLLRERLSREGVIYAQNWTTQAMALRMIEFYQEVLQRH